MAYKDQSSNQSNYEDTRRFNQPISKLFDMKDHSQPELQEEDYSSCGNNTSLYERRSHSHLYGRHDSHSFNESDHNQQSSKSSSFVESSTAWGEVSLGNSKESAQRSGYNSQKISDFSSANKHNQIGSPYEMNYQQSEHNQLKEKFRPSYEKIEPGRNQQSYQERVNPPYERDYEELERKSNQQSYQQSLNPPYHRDYEELERKSNRQSYQERVNPPYDRDYEEVERKTNRQSYQERVNPSYERDYEKPERESYQQSYQERVNQPFERDFEKTEANSNQQSYQKKVHPLFEQDYQSTRSGNYKETQLTDRFERITSDPKNYYNDNFQQKLYTSNKIFDQVGFESTSEGSNENFGNQRNVFRGDSYRGEFQSRRQKGRGNFAGKTHLVDSDLESRGWFESRNNEMDGPQEHNPKLLQCSEKGLPSEECNNDEYNDKEGEQATKINRLIIDKALYEKYKFYPPTAEEMGSIFEGIVIFFAYHFSKSLADNILFDVICDSFRKSAQFDNLQVEDGYDVRKPFRKFCTLRYNGVMMVRGTSNYDNKKEARIWAAVELINKLAMTCYTLKIRESYYSIEGSENILKSKECPGLFRVVPDEEVPDVESAFNYIKNFFNKEDSDCELVFTNPKILCPLMCIEKENPQYDTRLLASTSAQGFNPIAVFKRHSPQYWRDKILASGKMDNEKYTLTPPQGLGNDLLEISDVRMAIPMLNCLPIAAPTHLYDPQTTSNIRCEKTSW